MSRHGEDFYQIDALLSEDEIAIRDQVREWVNERYLPIIEKAYEEGYFPKDVIPELAELGLFGATLPEKYGCAGIGATAYGLIMQELERGDSGLRSFVSVQGALCMYPIFEYGSEEQRKSWLPPMAKGEVIGCFGLTEPDFGSDPGGMITRAQRVDGGWVLNGAKMWITNGTGRPGDRLGQAPRRGQRQGPCHGLPGREGLQGLLGAGTEAQALAARLGDQRAHPAGRVRARLARAARGQGPQGGALLPHPGALRHRLRRHRRRDGVLRRRAWTTARAASCSASRSARFQLVQEQARRSC